MWTKLVVITTILAITGTALAQTPQAAAPSPKPAKAPVEAYVLAPEDQIVIRAAHVPDISEKPIRIDPSGYLNMPMIGRYGPEG